MKKKSDSQNPILKSWEANASAWIKTLEQDEIGSRKLFTNQAIIDAILTRRPHYLLDAGCGEGWLTRELHQHGIQADGFDGVAALIKCAQQHGQGQYFTLSYDDIRNGQQQLGQYDAIVFNYSLFEKEQVFTLLNILKKHLSSGGYFLIQTISDQNELYASRSADGWMTEDWKALHTDYPAPFRWYYRSTEEWLQLFDLTALELVEKKEVRHPLTDQAFSVIYAVRKLAKKF